MVSWWRLLRLTDHERIPFEIKFLEGILFLDHPYLLKKKQVMITQKDLDNFIAYLKKDKYKNKIQDLKLNHCTDEQGNEFIYLVLIQIKKSQRNMGYGSALLSDIINFLDQHQIEMRLYATNLYGADLKRLYGFYRKHGLVLIKNNNDGQFVYRPKKIKRNSQ